MLDIDKIRKDFPILKKKLEENLFVTLIMVLLLKNLRLLLKPLRMGMKMSTLMYIVDLHFLSNLATEKFEAVRGKIQNFLGAKSENEIIFTSGSTEGINLVAYAWAQYNLKKMMKYFYL